MFKRFLMIAVAAALPIVAAAQEPIAVVAHVLSLSEEQLPRLVAFLQSRQETLRPVAEEMQAHQRALAELLQTADPEAQKVGQLVLEIRKLEQQVRQVLHDSDGALDEILTAEQRARLEQIRGAAPVCEIVPAFKALGLM